MNKKTSLKYRITFNQNVLDEKSNMFSESVSRQLLNKKILFFDQWGTNFCEGFLDVNDYTQERRPEDLFFGIIKKSSLFELVKELRVVLDDNGLEYKISIIDNQIIEIATNSPKNGGLTIYYSLDENEKVQYLSNGIDTLRDRIKDMGENLGQYKVVSWR